LTTDLQKTNADCLKQGKREERGSQIEEGDLRQRMEGRKNGGLDGARGVLLEFIGRRKCKSKDRKR